MTPAEYRAGVNIWGPPHPRWHYWTRCWLFGHGQTLRGRCIDCGRYVGMK